MNSKPLLLFASLWVLGVGHVQAAAVFITNHSFEDDDIANNTNSNSAPSGWSVTGGSGSYLDRNGSGGFNDQIDPTPDTGDSEQMAWSNGGDFFQLTGTAIAANTLYTLTVDMGDRTNLGFPGAELRLGSGAPFGSNLLTPTVVSNTIPTNGAGPSDGWQTWTTTFTTGASPVAGNLRVELLNTGGTQPLFDNVRLDATAIPEPSTVMLSTMASLLLLRRRRK